MIRKADITDLPDIVGIYNQAIISRSCTGDTVCFNTNERKDWFKYHDNIKTPIYVYENESKVIAYSLISSYRPGRQAFEDVGEISYYVDFFYHGKGVGSKMIEHIIQEAINIGYRNLIAIILDCNKKSASLLEKNNFNIWGILPNIANIDNNNYSHIYYGLHL